MNSYSTCFMKRNPAYFFSESQETTFSDPTPFLPIYTPYNYTHNINRGLGVYLEKAFRMDMKYTYLLMKHSFSERGIATLHVSEKKPGVLFL